MIIQPGDRLRLLGGILQLQNDRLKQVLQFILIWLVLEDIGAQNSVALETGYWRGHSLGSIKF